MDRARIGVVVHRQLDIVARIEPARIAQLAAFDDADVVAGGDLARIAQLRRSQSDVVAGGRHAMVVDPCRPQREVAAGLQAAAVFQRRADRRGEVSARLRLRGVVERRGAKHDVLVGQQAAGVARRPAHSDVDTAGGQQAACRIVERRGRDGEAVARARHPRVRQRPARIEADRAGQAQPAGQRHLLPRDERRRSPALAQRPGDSDGLRRHGVLAVQRGRAALGVPACDLGPHASLPQRQAAPVVPTGYLHEEAFAGDGRTRAGGHHRPLFRPSGNFHAPLGGHDARLRDRLRRLDHQPLRAGLAAQALDGAEVFYPAGLDTLRAGRIDQELVFQDRADLEFAAPAGRDIPLVPRVAAHPERQVAACPLLAAVAHAAAEIDERAGFDQYRAAPGRDDRVGNHRLFVVHGFGDFVGDPHPSVDDFDMPSRHHRARLVQRAQRAIEKQHVLDPQRDG
ncbi:Uncharacterised protein [Bordetella pertussis]|nr:Uncharacterised protein [Bordetella pertussis]